MGLAIVSKSDLAGNLHIGLLVGVVFGSALGLAVWVTRLKRRVSLLCRISWGLVTGVAAIVISYVPLSVWCYVTNQNLSPVSHSPRRIDEAMLTGLFFSVLVFPIGFIVGAIMAPFKQPKE